MDWPTVVGVGSLVLLALAAGFAAVRATDQSYQHGREAVLEMTARAEQERLRKIAEVERDDAAARAVKAEGERDVALRRLQMAEAIMSATEEDKFAALKKEIDDAEADDLIAASRRVLAGGVSPSSADLPQAIGPDHPASAGGDTGPSTVSPAKAT